MQSSPSLLTQKRMASAKLLDSPLPPPPPLFFFVVKGNTMTMVRNKAIENVCVFNMNTAYP